MTYPKTDELLATLNTWTRPLIEHPAFRQLVRSKIASAFDWEDDGRTASEGVSEVILPEPLGAQRDAVLKFYHLWMAAERIKTVEFYFRRYPFRGLPIPRHEHLENICAMFFSHFYVFQERLREYLNALNKVCAPAGIDVGKTLRAFQRRFKAELRERHGGTHFEPFEDSTIHAVMLRSMRDHDGATGDRAGALYAYQKASREWAGNARRGGERVAAFLEAVADATLQIATFLETPPSPGPEELNAR